MADATWILRRPGDPLRLQGEMARFQEPVACHRLLILRLVINR